MENTKIGAELPQVVIDGYKITIRVTDKQLNLTDILSDLFGRQLEKL